MGPAAALIGSALIGGIGSAYGAKKQQQASVQMAREQMAFQERMSNTAYQRAAKDLEAAGLNRILALGSPASSPGGAMGTAQNILGAGTASAISAAQASAGIRAATATARKTAAEAHRTEMENVPLEIKTRAIKELVEPAATTAVDAAKKGIDGIKNAKDLRDRMERMIPGRSKPVTRAVPPGNAMDRAIRDAYEHADFVRRRDGKMPSDEYIQRTIDVLFEKYKSEPGYGKSEPYDPEKHSGR